MGPLVKFLIVTIGITSCSSGGKRTPKMAPKALKIEKKMTIHGDTRVDPYFWMRERDTPRVMDYLKAENAYANNHLESNEPLKNKIFEEMKGRKAKTDSSVPWVSGDYYYYRRFSEESEHPILARKKGSLKAEEELLLNSDSLAKTVKYFNLGGWSVSPNHQLLAYSTDTKGRRFYSISIKDLKSGRLLKTAVKDVTGSFEWAEDSRTLFYTKQNPVTLRSEWIYAIDVKTGKNRLIFHEKDEKFYTDIYKTTSKKYLVIHSESTESTESLIIPAARPFEKPKLFSPRRANHEYSVSHAGGFFFVRSNASARNFKVFRTPDERRTHQMHWQSFIPHRNDILLRGLSVFKDFLVLSIRKQGVTELEVMDRKSGRRYIMDQPEKSHVVGVSFNPNYSTAKLRYVYSSLTTPVTVYDYNFKDKTKTVKKVEPVLGGFDSKNYVSERIFATADDGAQVPISLVYRKGTPRDGSAPLLLYGYGSYGYSIEPEFSSTRLSLLDRGFVYGIAHIRGSSTMGRQWYLDGKYLKKKNTFKDFIASAEHLIASKYTGADRVFAEGRSAGGLLMGAVINMRPDLFHGVIAGVPFVDVVSTMLDESLPLTTNEYEEWGNPNEKKYYDYMKSYSPYDNVKKQSYPNLLVLSGYHDSQVQYWEPTKWVAKLRDFNTGPNVILLDTNLVAGHGGKSGRFKALEDKARDYAFIVSLWNQKKGVE